MEKPGRIHLSSLPSSCRWFVQVLALAVVYHIVGRLGTLLTAPPISAAPVWPAAGVALAALLLFGCRIWPGVLLGSFLINVGMTSDAAAGSTFLKPALIAL